MIAVDSSAWIEFLRRTDHPVRRQVRRLVRTERIATTEVVAMELLAGARTDAEEELIREHLAALTMLPLEGLADFEAAAGLYRACRRAGETIRSMTDCLTAAVAIRSGARVLHADRDFDAIARHSDLQLVAY